MTHTPPPPPFEQPKRIVSPEAVAYAGQVSATIRREIDKVYIGRSETVELLIIALLARGHVLLEGVPGIAKTTLVKAFAETLGCTFSRVQFTPDLLPADITGTNILNLKDQTFSLRAGPIFAHVVLGDEINRAPAKTQSALLEAMQESQVTIEGETKRLPAPFIVLATQNPVEQEGVYALPEAQVDRFTFRIRLGYPTVEDELTMLSTYNEAVSTIQPALNPEQILQLSEATESVFVSPELLDYVVRLVHASRAHPAVLLGASPRASLAFMRCAKARALIHGRDHVLPDDIRALAQPIMQHRLILTSEADLDRIEPERVVNDVVDSVAYVATE